MPFTARARAATFDEWVGAAIFLAAVAASGVTWYDLAVRAAFPAGLAAVPAIGLDVGALFFGRAWVVGRTSKIRAWGRIATVAAVVVSVAGNAVEHAVAAGLLAVTLPIVVIVGAVPAVAAFGVAHLMALNHGMTRAAVPSRARISTAPAAALAPAAPEVRSTRRPPTPPTVASPARPSMLDEVTAGPSTGKRAAALIWTRAHWPVAAAEIRMGVRPVEITITEACRVRDKVAAEHAKEVSHGRQSR